MSEDWTARLAGARMQVDQQFEHRVQESEFTSQEWGLIMTAVEFDVRQPTDPEAAKLYADTGKLPEIIPELERIQREMGGSPTPVDEGPGGGIGGRLKRIKEMVTPDRSTSSDSKRQAAAERLVQSYASELQTYLEERDRWEDIRLAARDAANGED